MKVFIFLCVISLAFASTPCGENQHYESCGTDCPLTCDNYDNPPKFCNLMCKIGCQCDNGYVETDDGRCVRPEDCPARVNHARQFSSDVCDLPAKSGLCDAYMPRYFFDSNRGECRRFIYGGCGGNGNNFRTIEECQKACE